MTEGNWFSAWRAVVQRELAMGMRQKGEVLTPLVFFVIVASLFPDRKSVV